MPANVPHLPESPASESELSDDTVDVAFNPLINMSDATVRMLSSPKGSHCGIHSSDQCLVRCVQCLESFCSGLVLYDIHREVDQAWSCRACLLQPASILRKPEVSHSAALANSEPAESTPDSILITSLMEPVRGVLKTIPTQSKKDESEETEKSLSKLNPMMSLDPEPAAKPISLLSLAPELRKFDNQILSHTRLPRPRSRHKRQRSSSAVEVDAKETTASIGPVVGQKRARLEDYVSAKGGKRLKRFRCSYCPKRFDQRSNLIAHIRSHTGEKPFTCKVCKRPFSQKSNMTRHMKVHRR